MTLSPIPNLPFEVDPGDWNSFKAEFNALQEQELTADTIDQWLADWSALSNIAGEVGSVAYIETSQDTADETRQKAFLAYVENVRPEYQVADQALKMRLLAFASDEDIPVEGMAIPLRNLRNQADLFREENVPLLTELTKLGNEYDKITGAMKADWDGEEKNLSQLKSLLLSKDRQVRRRAWETMLSLWLAERDGLNELFVKMLGLRQQIATNAGLADFREYTFRNYDRFAYTPAECLQFHEAIEQVVVPAASRVYERRRQRMGLDTLRPWDVDVEPGNDPSLTPYKGQDELIQSSLNIFNAVDPEMARYIAVMAEEDLLDLDTRAGKALGGYCSSLAHRKRAFIFMNGDGTHDDVQTMLHEAGHAFHSFEAAQLPLTWQADVPMEFAEVASMAMELLSSPYLTRNNGGFYSEVEAARARSQHLSEILTFLPYMAVVDAFQHWVYTHPEAAADVSASDAKWDELWGRFMPDINWSGLEEEQMTGWHRKLHIFHVPFYYIEYGMAQVGALQVWRNALQDQQAAVEDYRSALALGGTRTLPELYEAAGAEFCFDVPMLSELVTMIEDNIEQLDAIANG